MRNTLTLLILLYTGVSGASNAATETSPCPGLVSSYDIEKFERVLVVTDAEFASIEDCEQLGRFFFDPSNAARYALDYAGLGAIVDQVWQPVNEEAPFLLIEAVLSWLKGLGFEQHAESLRDFVDEYLPANESVQLFFTVVIWLIVIATVLLIVHEFYKAGMLRLPRSRHRPRSDRAEEHKPAIAWQAILALPLREQIGALLQYSIERLAEAKLVSASRSYTNRELVAQLETADTARARVLSQQIDLTEPVIYGDDPVTEERVTACRLKAEELGDA
jgi:hypothetical protein